MQVSWWQKGLRTLLPLGANGRSRAGGFVRCPEEPRGPAQGKGTGRGMEGKSPLFCKVVVVGPMGVQQRAALFPQRLPLRTLQLC